MSDEGMKITVDGVEYAVDDFEGRELVDAERSFNISLFYELDRGSATGVYALIYLIEKRKNADFTVDHALSMNLGDVQRLIERGDTKESQDPPSKVAAKAKSKSG